jgi:V8-like Glu-specific endopeptidase
MIRAKQDPDATASAPTQYPGPLDPPKVGVEKHEGGSAGTVTHRLVRRDRATPSFPNPSTYADPREKYVLEEEPDRYVRLVRTAPEGKIKRLPGTVHRADADNRIRVEDTAAWPFSAVGHLVVTFPSGRQYIGSGTMVNRHHVLTAGHLVFSNRQGGWATSIQFNAAQNEASLPFGSAFATRLFTFKRWIDHEDRDYDTGMLHLDRDLGNATGWMGLITTSDASLSKHQITVAGYPMDKGGQQMWSATAPIVDVTSHQIAYDTFTILGQSGAGVYGRWPGFRLEHVCADHVAGLNGVPNLGSRLARGKFDRIVAEWMSN